MKNKIFLVVSLLSCIGLGTLIGCSNNQAKANEPSYLKYCGQTASCNVDDYVIETYEDNIHNKVVYIITDNNGHAASIATSDLK